MTPSAAKHLKKAERDLRERFPDAPIFSDYGSMIDWLEVHLR
jgi:hypothetical protein